MISQNSPLLWLHPNAVKTIGLISLSGDQSIVVCHYDTEEEVPLSTPTDQDRPLAQGEPQKLSVKIVSLRDKIGEICLYDASLTIAHQFLMRLVLISKLG